MKNRVITGFVKVIGDKMIREAGNGNSTYKSVCFTFHEVERPECLKKLDQEKMAKQ